MWVIIFLMISNVEKVKKLYVLIKCKFAALKTDLR
jgi:hypothetical protein